MAASPLIVGRNTKIQYGTNARYTFSIAFPTSRMTSSGGTNVNRPTAGTLTIAGVTVTLAAGDIVQPLAVCKKIAATAISGYTVFHDPKVTPNSITLVNNTVGVTAVPALALGTATNVLFTDQSFVAGAAMPTVGAQEDIDINGRTPVIFTVTYAGGTSPTLAFSYGTAEEQARGALTYGTAVTLAAVNGVANSYSLTTPAKYAKLTTIAGNTTAALIISR